MINKICSVEDEVADNEHKHVCPNCKTCWKHDEDSPQASTEAFDEAHTCPGCGWPDVTKKLMDSASLNRALDRLLDTLSRMR